MNVLFDALEFFLRPFASALFLPSLLLIMAVMTGRGHSGKSRAAIALWFALVFHIAFDTAQLNPKAALWLARIENPFMAFLAVLAIPAILLRAGIWRRGLLALSIAGIALAGLEITFQYKQVPSGQFIWFPMRPLALAGAFMGLLVLAGQFLPLNLLRKTVRIACLVLLLYGGFAFRQSWTDYTQAVERRPHARTDIMTITETVPVLRDDNRLSYAPAAPCRFSADGGYFQGCNMELAQRIMQMDFAKIRAGDTGEISLAAKVLAACLALFAMCFVAGRWWCGWVCPLSTLGDGFDLIRRAIRLPHLKPARTVKLSYLLSGISLSSFGLLLARAWPNLDANGMMLGCKIPLYPFCKICPGQQVCPIASRGLAGISPLPGAEWLFGFFRYGIVALLLLFIVSFLTSRRLWCRFCPMGMLGGLFNGGAMVALKKNPVKCNGCGACNEVCPMDIHHVQAERVKHEVTTYDCVLCLKCVAACPQDACLSVELAHCAVCESEFKPG
ncbi:MAG: 4Fe-4S binding protein [Verrucomicrobia bacterium]|nr:4Fe-4S binding protein [Verrucomicrobiota bacterium]MBU4247245.1 4Fe-4S binding protein [Verrucomicrobiota bacterium]MBU4289949.1 4Fe-4S binding protein [Verrucomicrobiota bacterium]MBU4498056.1 4Fe-4S binding protein [Verrucomicrobiota bacterium]MCG2679703.1 4Fe-4S binding protein [Kiritimatiellia bacterium]